MYLVLVLILTTCFLLVALLLLQHPRHLAVAPVGQVHCPLAVEVGEVDKGPQRLLATTYHLLPATKPTTKPTTYYQAYDLLPSLLPTTYYRVPSQAYY